MKKTPLTPLLLAALLLGGCETVVDVEPPEHERQLVVNGLYQAGTPWVVEVTTSVGLLEIDEPATVTNASVVLWHDDRPLDTLRYRPVPDDQPYYYGGNADGHYHSDAAAAPGQTYTLRVSAPGFDPVEATSVVPDRPAATFDVRTRLAPPDPNYPPEYRPTLAEVDIHLDDPAGERNYYALSVMTEQRYAGADSTEFVTEWLMGFHFSDPLLEDDLFDEDLLDGDGSTYRWGRLYFSDRNIDGRRHTLHVTTTLDPGAEDRRSVVVLEALSPDIYEYERTRDRYREADGNPFAEPVEVHSNMSNGFGIFAGASAVERALR